jgi:hypothetical protein
VELFDATQRTLAAPQPPVERGHGFRQARIVVLQPTRKTEA